MCVCVCVSDDINDLCVLMQPCERVQAESQTGTRATHTFTHAPIVLADRIRNESKQINTNIINLSE